MLGYTEMSLKSISSMIVGFILPTGGANDYILVTEHESIGVCLLGYKLMYKLTKEESM